MSAAATCAGPPGRGGAAFDRLRPAAVVLALLATVCWPALARAERAPSRQSGFAEVRPACAAPAAGRARCFALVRDQVSSADAGRPGVRPYTAGDGAATAGPAGGLTPEALEVAYGYSAEGGAGQTIAVVDAFNDPKIEEDLAAFDAHYGLGECTKANGCFRVVSQFGSESKLPANDQEGWSWEISVDVEAARATCQGCRIVLVEANSDLYGNLAAAANEAVALGATEVSNSYGGPEAALGANVRTAYNHPGIVFTASTGDDGYDDWDYELEGLRPPGMPNAPASLPSVVAVGGTSLHLRPDGTRASESVWNDDGFNDIKGFEAGYITGGGCSTLFTAPGWQAAAPGYGAASCGGHRLAADVAAVGDPMTGFDVYDDFNYCGCKEVAKIIEAHKGWETFGGTSLSSPIVAAMYALAGGSAGLADPAVTLYAHLGDPSTLFDVAEGGNGLCAGEPATRCGSPNAEYGATVDCEGTTACDAAAGLDGPSGVGAPVGLQAFEPAFPSAVITPPSSLVANAPATFGSGASTDPYPGGSIAAWTWSFGDGTGPVSEPAPTHVYSAPGDYTVTLAVRDAFGLAGATAEIPVHVGAAPPPTPGQGVAPFVGRLIAPAARIVGGVARVGPAGAFRVRISCPPGVVTCVGTVTLRTTTAGSRKAHALLTLSSARFSVAAGRTATVRMHLAARGRARIARAHVLLTRATVSAHDPAGAAATTRALVTLRPALSARRR